MNRIVALKKNPDRRAYWGTSSVWGHEVFFNEKVFLKLKASSIHPWNDLFYSIIYFILFVIMLLIRWYYRYGKNVIVNRYGKKILKIRLNLVSPVSRSGDKILKRGNHRFAEQRQGRQITARGTAVVPYYIHSEKVFAWTYFGDSYFNIFSGSSFAKFPEKMCVRFCELKFDMKVQGKQIFEQITVD